MSGYSEAYREQRQEKWLNKWVPHGDPHMAERVKDGLPQKFVEQYRFTLARARSAEAKLKEHETVLRGLKDLLP